MTGFDSKLYFAAITSAVVTELFVYDGAVISLVAVLCTGSGRANQLRASVVRVVWAGSVRFSDERHSWSSTLV